ncbi:MAG: ABC transporter substrate-binding protein [Chloroflexi bacterium]|nr:ABC transporter substrate-binding protein [Chloroflexota bacterium]
MVSKRVIAFLGLLALLLAACGPAATATPATAPTARFTPTPAGPTGKLTVAWQDFQFEKLDPTQESLGERQAYVGPMFESLLAVKPIEGTPTAALAERWETSADGQTWTFFLRKDVKFHNGDPMTAEDVKFSWERWTSAESKSAQKARFKTNIASVDVVDPYTVKYNLTAPWPSLPYFLAPRGAAEGTILPKKYVEQIGWEAFEQKPVGTGAWKFSQREVGTFVEYEAVADHWRKAPEFKTLRMLKVPEERTRVAMLRNGEVDIAPISIDAISEVQGAGFNVVKVPNTVSFRIHLWGSYVPESGPLNDIRVRQALNLAINREEFASSLFPGAASVAAFFPPAPDSLGFPRDIKPYLYDVARAKALLAEAGVPNGFNLDLFSGALGTGLGPEVNTRGAETVASYWEKIGVKAKIIPTDIAFLRPRYQKHPQSELIGKASTFNTTAKDLAVLDAAIFFLNSQGKGGVRLADNVDDLINGALKATSEAELVRLSEETYRKLHSEYRGVPLVYVSLPYGVGPRVTNVLYSPGFESIPMFLEYAKRK